MLYETDRCIVRQFKKEDLDSFIVYRNNMEWMKFQSFKGKTLFEYEQILLQPQNVSEGAQFAIIEKNTQKLIGDIYLYSEENVFWVGYTLNPEFSRQGYAFEAVTGCLSWIKTQGGKIVKAGVDPENKPSIRLLEKLGFKYSYPDKNGEIIYIQVLKKDK